MVLKAPGNRVLGMPIFPIMTRDANGSPILHTFDSKKEKKKKLVCITSFQIGDLMTSSQTTHDS